MNINLLKFHPDAKVPTYGSDGAAGFDLYALESGIVLPGVVAKIRTGIGIEVPQYNALLISARSGHGAAFGAGVPHGYGLVDSDYRGELFMVLTTTKVFHWEAGDRIGQGIIVPVMRVDQFVEVDALSPTLRGTGGFGSTGS